jgi:hypothetical protein
MVMLSDLLRYRLIDNAGRSGRLADLAIDLAAGEYPPVTHLLTDAAGHGPAELGWGAAGCSR